MIKAGLNEEGVKRLLNVPWWDEMVDDIIETPEMCDPDELPQEILEYARDVHAGTRFDIVVAVAKTTVQASRPVLTDGRLARPHGTDEKDSVWLLHDTFV